MRAIDVCAGAGGLSLALQRAGFDVLGVESNRDAVDTHRRHVGPCVWADIELWCPPFADLVAGGVPCTPFSPAGRRRGVEDERYLVPDFLRIARMSGARAVLLENSAGLVTNRKGEDFAIVILAFAREGWWTKWRILDAADYGVPQHRRRVFLVGFRDMATRDAFHWPEPTHAPPGLLFGLPHVTVREALGLPASIYRHGRKEGASGYQGMRLLDVDKPGFVIGAQTKPDLLDEPAPCVTASEHKSAMSGSQPMRRRRRASERRSEALSALDIPAPTVRPNAYHEAPDPVRASRRPMANVAAALEAARLADRPATTIAADPRLAPAGHHGNAPGDRQMTRAVRLTVEQCAILQGFPRDWTWTGNKTSQHRQVGNAVPPALGEPVARSMREALER